MRLRSLFSVLTVFLPSIAFAAPAQPRLAENMREVEGYFAGCIAPPEGDAQVIFYFSMKADGEMRGRPRIVWYGSKDEPADQRATLLSEYRDAILHCMPLHLDEPLASTIAGKVYLLKVTVADGKTDVVLRPYGSMGPPLVNEILPY